MVTPACEPARVLVAGLGNIFLGDDGFGVEVARRLAEMRLPEHVRVLDVGTRALHLAYEVRDGGYDALILVDAVSRGGRPGALYVLEPDSAEGAAVVSPPAGGHALLGHDVLGLVRQLGGDVRRVRIVACEPSRIGPDAGLSSPVEAALDGAVELVLGLLSPAAGAAAEV